MIFQQLCLYLNLLIADSEDPRPTIGIHPMFFKATYDLPNRSLKYISPLTFVSYKGISLEFSVDYKYSQKNSLEDISRNFILNETELTLTKYIKKSTPLEVYTREVHKPQKVNLPTTIQPLFGFSLYIGQTLTKCDIGTLKTGSQLISLYINYEGALEAKNSIEQIEKFREFLGIDKTENTLNYGFRFTIKLKPRQRKKQTLVTNMFQVVFSKKHEGVYVLEVKNSDYHIDVDIEEMKFGCVIS